VPNAGQVYVKRDDISSPIYGGNKVRTLESLFGSALAQGCTQVVAVGAYGSNHAVATVLHAPRASLGSGAIVFPQPVSDTARDNLRVTAVRANELHPLWHWSAVPFAMWSLRRRLRGQERNALVMPPGGANPIGALGYVSAALELADQVRAAELPAPGQIVLGVGSTCTSAGLLLGCALATRLGIGFRVRPQVVSVRVTPWPVTSRFRIISLALRTAELLRRLSGDDRFAFSKAELGQGLQIDGRFLGAGYGKITNEGLQAMQTLAPWGPQALDTTYGAKSAAGLLARMAITTGPIVYWATKSSVPLPSIPDADLARAPASVLNWLRD
jgi:D-cysteine desulfhydrase